MACNIVRRYALETVSEQGFGIGEKVAHHCVDRPDNAASISPGDQGKPDLDDRFKLALGLHITILNGILMQI